jgi:hypothetical protein
MNKETKLQFVQLFKEVADEMAVSETPTYDDLSFMPIASDRHTHTAAVLALATDINAALADADADTVELSA